MEKENESLENQPLEKQEIWAKFFFNGYSCTFAEKMLSVEIRIPNPNFGEKDRYKGRTLLFSPLKADENGHVDITPLMVTLLMEMKSNPQAEVKAYITGFHHQIKLNSLLLNKSFPLSLVDLFKIKEPRGEES